MDISQLENKPVLRSKGRNNLNCIQHHLTKVYHKTFYDSKII